MEPDGCLASEAGLLRGAADGACTQCQDGLLRPGFEWAEQEAGLGASDVRCDARKADRDPLSAISGIASWVVALPVAYVLVLRSFLGTKGTWVASAAGESTRLRS